MPQISLYIDNDTLKKVEQAAKLEKKSISKWVSSKLQSSLISNWPKNWFNLYGCIQDESFVEPEELNIDADTKRENL